MLKATVARGTLYESAQIVGRAVSGRSTLPVLNNFFIEGRDQTLRLVATDLEVGMEAIVDAKVEEQGSLTVPARILTEVLANLPEADVSLEVDESNAVQVTCRRSDYHIRGLPAEEFSTLPDLLEPLALELPQAVLRRAILETTFASSPDETRPILTGALFALGADEIRVVATDTHRLALRKLPGSAGLSESLNVIVPARVLNEVSRVLRDDAEEPVDIAVSENQVRFRVGRITVQSRLIDGQFPNYEKVIPEASERRVVARTAELQDALRRALIVAREDANRVKLEPAGDVMTILADSQDVGRVNEEVPVELKGDALEIAFNARYLLDVLNVMESENVELALNGPLNPGLVRAPDDDSYVYVLMPMQIM